MNCNDVQEQISSLFDCELHDGESKHVFAHLSGCDECRSFLQTLIQLRSALSSEKQIAVPATLDERVLSIQLGIAKPAGRFEKQFASWWQNRLAIPVPAVAFTILVGLLFSALTFVLLSKQTRLEQQKASQVVYIIDMQPIEVQDPSVSPNHKIQ